MAYARGESIQPFYPLGSAIYLGFRYHVASASDESVWYYGESQSGAWQELPMDIPKSWAPLVGVLEYASTMTLLHLKKMHYVNGVFVYNATCSVGSHDHFENKAQRKKTLLKGSMSLLWCSGFPREMCHGYIWKYQLHSRIFWLLLLVDLDA